MQMFHLFAIVATFRDFSERVVGLMNEREAATAEAHRMANAHCPARYIRTRVRPVSLDEAEVEAIVAGWGADDARLGFDQGRANTLGEYYRAIYLRAYHRSNA